MPGRVIRNAVRVMRISPPHSGKPLESVADCATMWGMMRTALLGGAVFLGAVSIPMCWVGCAAGDAAEGGTYSGSGGSGGGGGSTNTGGSTGNGGTGGSSGSGGTVGGDAGIEDASEDTTAMDGAPDSPEDVAAEADPCAAGCPADTWDIDGNPLTGTCGCEYQCHKTSSDDPIDPALVDDNCDGTDGVAEACVYVAANGVDDTTHGSRMAPVKTIAYAIQQAAAKHVDVCLAGETFSEFVQMVAGVSVYGGFDQNDPNFAFRRSNAVQTIITATGTVVEALTIDKDTHLEGLTIQALSPSSPAGASTYGIRLGGGTGKFYVRYNNINVAAGLDGEDGVDGQAGEKGADGAAGADGCDGCSGGGDGAPQTVSTCGVPGGKGGRGGYGNANGDAGGNGTGTSGGNGGASTGQCYSTSSTGGSASSVLIQGANGSPGGTSVEVGTLSATGYYEPPQAPSGTIGTPGASAGGGGGGGGGSPTLIWGICYSDRGGGGGGGGAGGCGGQPGSGGKGGGGSFAIAASGGVLIVEGNSLSVGRGGKGGKGGSGGAGGLGGSGGPGGAGKDDSGGGGQGGNGAPGGHGGPGSGGVGGPSACVIASSNVALTFQVGAGPTQNSCTNQGGGAGGPAGSNNGMTAQPGPTGKSGALISL